MSKYSSDSDDDYRGKSSRRKRRRSDSSSSRDSYIKNSKRRSRKSRSHSRDSYRTSSKAHKDKRSSVKDKSRSQRSRSPYRNRSRSRRRYRSNSRSRSRSRASSSGYTRKKSYSKSKRRYKSRSRSHSHHRKSRSRSRRRSTSRSRLKSYRSRSRSTSIPKRSKRSSSDKNGRRTSSSSNDGMSITVDCKPLEELHKQISQKPMKQENNFNLDTNRKLITIASDDPIVKQEQLDDINASSFTPKVFKSSKSSNHDRLDTNPLLTSLKLENELSSLPIANFGVQVMKSNDNEEKRVNETVFHDDIAFEDGEKKIQKWVKKVLLLRQKHLNGH